MMKINLLETNNHWGLTTLKSFEFQYSDKIKGSSPIPKLQFSMEKLVMILSIWAYTFNPLYTTGHLTPFLIGSYHKIFTCSTKYDKVLITLHHNLAYETFFFLIPSLIGAINARILTNQQVVLIGVIMFTSFYLYPTDLCLQCADICLIFTTLSFFIVFQIISEDRWMSVTAVPTLH